MSTEQKPPAEKENFDLEKVSFADRVEARPLWEQLINELRDEGKTEPLQQDI